jgi:hypothetical protein
MEKARGEYGWDRNGEDFQVLIVVHGSESDDFVQGTAQSIYVRLGVIGLVSQDFGCRYNPVPAVWSATAQERDRQRSEKPTRREQGGGTIAESPHGVQEFRAR